VSRNLFSELTFENVLQVGASAHLATVAKKADFCGNAPVSVKQLAKGPTDGKIKDSCPARKSKGAARKAGNPAALASFLAKKKEQLKSAAGSTDCQHCESDSAQSGGSSRDEDEERLVFDTFEPAQEDFDGMRAILKLMIEDEYDADGLVRLLIRQASEVGMVIKIADDDEVYGVMSVTNMSQASSALSLQQIGNFILAKCPQSMKETFANAITGNTGLLISERQPYIPRELAVPLLKALLEEIRDAQNSQVEKIKKKYSFDSYLILTKAVREAARDCETEADDAFPDLTWLKAEDAAFFKFSTATFEWALSQGEESEEQGWCCKAMLVSAGALDRVLSEVEQLIQRDLVGHSDHSEGCNERDSETVETRSLSQDHTSHAGCCAAQTERPSDSQIVGETGAKERGIGGTNVTTTGEALESLEPLSLSLNSLNTHSAPDPSVQTCPPPSSPSHTSLQSSSQAQVMQPRATDGGGGGEGEEGGGSHAQGGAKVGSSLRNRRGEELEGTGLKAATAPGMVFGTRSELTAHMKSDWFVYLFTEP
jgi:hypothetical protein